ncbi:MAG: arginine--tRNA ligase [Candidatus Pacebacteria bacterium]|jgi:arginyl-tRNA synthetase|nr:arginine--tRNA ligase [Candidatus Paceibacterota bacterium]|tara:strand:- start:31387 stop:33090 length:1704 start_codon:yes stop_codon:yes gene_type:complete
MIAEELEKKIREALDKLNISVEEISLEHPTELSHGDYSTNAALVAAKESGKNPKELAEEIVKNIESGENISKVEVAGPGFINFYLSNKFFAESIKEILSSGENWGRNKSLSGKKIIVEYTDPNPFKEFHIGHLMSNAVGESISRLMEFSGAVVKRANYEGDVGLHVAKAAWGLSKAGGDTSSIKALGEAYANGAASYEEDESAKKEIDEINKVIYGSSDSEINKLYESGRTTSLKYFEEIYGKLGTKFDYYFFESEVGDKGKEIVEENKNIFEESDGAVVYRGEEEGLHTRVFINSQGLPTYEAKELGLAFIKRDECPVRENSWEEAKKTEPFPYDLSFVITGNEIVGYFKVLLSALSKIAPELSEKTVHIPHGMMRLQTGKMSSRTGDVITGEALLNEVEGRVKDKMKDSGVELNEETSEQVSVGAVKYSVLRQSSHKDIIFDLEKSLSFEGDSGPYLQYTNARALSVLAKSNKEEKVSDDVEASILEKLLYRFPEVVERATELNEPHYVTTYLTELAGAFNSWYGNVHILDGTEDEGHKLALTRAVSETLKNGLWVLGIKAPERM